MGQAVGKKIYTKYSKEHNYTVLLLGETGSGKTSFLNLIANYKCVLRVLGNADACLRRDELRTFGETRVSDESLENAIEDEMASKTSDATLYDLSLANNMHLKIIDTPGFGDSRGLEVDQEHVKRIMKCLTKIKTINCVLITINGRQSRLTATMKYVLSQLTCVMPKSVLAHTAVVFTNTEKTSRRTFKMSCLRDVGLPDDMPSCCIDNPFGEVRTFVKETPAEEIDEESLLGFTGQIHKTVKTLEDFFWTIHDLEPVLSSSFAELNAKREEIETLLANIVETAREYHSLKLDLEKHLEQIMLEGRVTPLTRRVRRWFLMKDVYEWSHYICHHEDCHCNCIQSRVIAPFASIWCFFNPEMVCEVCNHVYADHRILCSGWESEDVTEEIELGESQDEAAEILRRRIEQAAEEKLNNVAALEASLEDYSTLGLRDAFVRLLRSQRTLLQQQMQSRPDDDTLQQMHATVEKQLLACEQAVELNCCICYENVADTVLSCGHRQFCHECSLSCGTCPVCRELVTSRRKHTAEDIFAASGNRS